MASPVDGIDLIITIQAFPDGMFTELTTCVILDNVKVKAQGTERR